MRYRLALLGVLCSAAPLLAVAQEMLPASDTAAPVAVTSVTLPAMTVVEIEILTPLNSKTSKMGEMFPIRLAEPIMLDGNVLVPAGATGEGEVIHAAKARAAGKAGEMILAARYIDYQGTRIVLRSFKFGPSTGKNNAKEALVAGAVVAIPLTLLIAGGNVDVPTGTRAHAKTAADTIFTEGEE